MRYSRRIVICFLTAVICMISGLSVDTYAFESNQKNEKANTFLVAENYREALLLYEKTLENDPADFEAGFGRAMCLVKLERYYQALEQLSEMQGTDEEELFAVSDSIRQIRQTLSCHPNAQVLSYYQNLLMNESSFSAMDIVLHQYPDYPETEYYKTMLYHEIFTYDFCSRLDTRILSSLGSCYQIAVTEYPMQEEFANAYRENLAIRIDRALALGELEQADTLMSQALSYDPENLRFQSEKGELLLKQREYQAAAETVKEALEVDPTLESAWEIRMRCAVRTHDDEDALLCANQLLSMNPENVYAYACLYQVSRKQGQKEDVRRYLETILEYDGSSYDKSCALALTGQYESAISCMEAAVKQDADCAAYARTDEDLKPLHFKKAFREIVQEEYVEERSDYYAAAILAVGALLYLILLLWDWMIDRIHKKRVKVTALVLLILLFGLVPAKQVSAQNYKLREKETRQMSEAQDISQSGFSEAEQSTVDSCCENELSWLIENIVINERTLTPLVQSDIVKAARMNECTTVNIQALKGNRICGQSSGVIVGYDSEKITVIGCRHTLYTNDLRVRFGNGDSARAELIGKSENYDFMVLQVAVSDLFIETKKYLKRASIDYTANANLQTGAEVVSDGFISTRGFIYFPGEITCLRKSFSNFKPYYTNHVPYLLTSTKAEAGTSGGGTFDDCGNLIGLQAGIVLATGERYVIPFDILVEEYREITGESLE